MFLDRWTALTYGLAVGLTATAIMYRPIAVAHWISWTMLTPIPDIAPSGPAAAPAALRARRLRDQSRLRRGSHSRKSPTTILPPGASTRTISAPARPGSVKWRSALVHSTAEKLPAGNGSWWASATTKAALGRTRARAWACWIIAGEASTPIASPTVAAASRTAAPVAQPTSRNRSPAARPRPARGATPMRNAP